MKILPAYTQESELDLHAQSVVEKAIDAIELMDEELESVGGAQFGWGGGFGGGFGGFGFGGFGFGFLPVLLIPVIPFFGGFW